jgi:HK97 family phage major capsid protein
MHHTNKADEMALVAARLETNRDARMLSAADILLNAKGGKLDNESWAAFRKGLSDANTFDEQHALVARFEKQARDKAKTIVSVRSEQRVYGASSPNSYFADKAAQATGFNATDANTRLRRYEQELAVERDAATTEGRYVQKSLREVNRTSEHRAMDTTSGSGGSFVSPVHLMQPALFKSPIRAFAAQCSSQNLPASGLEISIPSFQSSATTAIQSGENTAISTSSPTGAYLTTNLVTISGSVVVSQQLFDRGGNSTTPADTSIAAALAESLNAAVDSFVLTQCIAGGSTVAGAGAFSIAGLYGDLAKGREQLADTAGTRLRGTHLFTTSDFFGHVSSQLDTAGRPIVEPAFAAQPWSGLVAAGDPKGESWTGHVMPGGLAWFADDSIPTTDSGAETQLLVARPSEVLVFEGAPIVNAWIEPGASDLEVVIGLRSYVGIINRHPGSVSTISGAGYSSSLA